MLKQSHPNNSAKDLGKKVFSVLNSFKRRLELITFIIVLLASKQWVKIETRLIDWGKAVQMAKDRKVDGLLPAAVSEERKSSPPLGRFRILCFTIKPESGHADG